VLERRLLPGYEAFDQLASMVAIITPQGQCLHVNTALEAVVSLSRKALVRAPLGEWVADAPLLCSHMQRVAANEVAASRFDALIRRHGQSGELPVHVIVSQCERVGRAPEAVIVEMIEIEQQVRQDREERAHGFVQANKELVRNLAHEIRNPLGGIRGAAQLLEMEVATHSKGLTEYTQVIINEADRLQALVDRLLAPHRYAAVVSDVNIHEVCERVRSLVLAEYPRGLVVQRDYDTSIPEFRGDREQLIQALLNIAHNATQALAERIAEGEARLVLRTRIARQVTIGRQRFRLALELQVQDNGPGVAEAIRDRIFQPLVSGREGGSGLGLTLAQTFVQQHQGSIECESVPGHTVFKLLIPLP
jgi:two-component system, NtrC family, nitrogen regulation sensor histidine kinase GlnL